MGVGGLSLGSPSFPRPPPGQALVGHSWDCSGRLTSSHSSLLFFHIVIGTRQCPSLPFWRPRFVLWSLFICPWFFFFCTETILWIGPFFLFRSGNRSGSTGTVLLVNLLPAGFHGDGHAHPTPARGHSGHLAPGVRVWIIALHAVQECVTVVAPCREGRRDGRSLLQGGGGWGGVGRKEACEALLLKGARWASPPRPYQERRSFPGVQ